MLINVGNRIIISQRNFKIFKADLIDFGRIKSEMSFFPGRNWVGWEVKVVTEETGNRAWLVYQLDHSYQILVLGQLVNAS